MKGAVWQTEGCEQLGLGVVLEKDVFATRRYSEKGVFYVKYFLDWGRPYMTSRSFTHLGIILENSFFTARLSRLQQSSPLKALIQLS